MKKFLIAVALLFGLSAGIFIACSDYDEDMSVAETATVGENVSVITTSDSKKWVVTNANGYTYNYDDGKCVAINGYEQEWDLADLKNVMVADAVFPDDVVYNAKLAFNSLGYLSKIELKANDTAEETTQTMEITYNCDNQISDFTYRSLTNFKNAHGSVEDYKYVVNFEYEEGNLTKATVNVENFEDFYEDGRTYKDDSKETYVFTYKYYGYENKYQQNLAYPIIGEYAFDYDELLQTFAYTGWLGKGSKVIPETYSYTYSIDGSSADEKGPYAISYDRNDYGMIGSWQYEEVQ